LRDQDLSITDAAVQAAKVRLCPIVMTSFAFILGVLPLVLRPAQAQPAKIRLEQQFSEV